MPSSGTHDAVLLYNGKDIPCAKALVCELERLGLRVWFADRDVDYGDPIATEISRALAGTGYALVCIGTSGLSGYLRDVEVSTLLSMAALKKVKLVPIYVDAQSAFGPDNPPEVVLLSGMRGIDCRRAGITGNGELSALAAQVGAAMGRASGAQGGSAGTGAGRQSPAASAAPTSPDRVSTIVRRIAQRLDDSGLVVAVGPYWPGNAIPRSEEVSLELLSQTLGWDAVKRELYGHAPLLPAETAALAYSLANDLQDRVAEEVARVALAPRSFGIPAAFIELARLMTTVARHSRAERGRAVIFTTNIDCALERAFVKEGLAFTALVFDLSAQRYRRTAFPAAVGEGDARTMTSGGRCFAARGASQLSADERDRYQKQYANFVTRGGDPAMTSLGDFIHTLELNELLRAFDACAAEQVTEIGENEQREAPLLVKLLGSSLIRGSALVSSDRHYQLARSWERLGNVAKAILTDDVSIIAGYSLCDPVFWLLFDTLLRDAYRRASHNVRYALLPRVGDKDGDGDVDALRRIVQAKVVSVPPPDLHLGLEANIDEVEFFHRLSSAVGSRPSSPWD
ncbi:MAG TPA: TIR domain-containing protein [Alphaproteobacteria bacterium]|nr:TIR domain-containing protein [Alphaproteobacteria bacterium]